MSLPLGTGKSLLLRAIINALRKKYAKKPEYVSVTASTGMAASNIGGRTLSPLAWPFKTEKFGRNDDSCLGSYYARNARHREVDQLR